MGIFFDKKKRKYFIAGSVTGTICILMVIFPTVALFSAREGIYIWMGSVLPALLPFFICANFICCLGISKYINSGILPFVMSIISGYPMGAKIIGDMARKGDISSSEAKRLISFCSTSGPTFMISAVGLGMLNSVKAGAIIALSHYAGAVINGIVFSCLIKPEGKAPYAIEARTSDSILEILTESIVSAFKSLGIILAYIVIFMFLTDLLQLGGVFQIADDPAARGIFKGFFEMTVGCSSITASKDISYSFKIILSTFAVSWGGLSIIGQTMSMLSGSGVGAGHFVLTKLLHGVISAIIALIICDIVII